MYYKVTFTFEVRNSENVRLMNEALEDSGSIEALEKEFREDFANEKDMENPKIKIEKIND